MIDREASADTDEPDQPVELEVCSTAVTQWLLPDPRAETSCKHSGWRLLRRLVRLDPERSVFTAAGVGDHRGDQWYQCESLSVNTPRLCSSHCGEPLFDFRSLKWSVIILLKVVVTLMSAGLYYCTVKVLLISQTSAGTTTCRHSEASFIKGSFF